MRLTILDFGTLAIAPNGEHRGFPGYLVQTAAGENILVDTGWPERWTVDVEQALADDGLGDRLSPVALGPENSIAGQLALVGLTPGDIDLLVLTHSDPDHIGGIATVPKSIPIVISAAERALDRPRYQAEPTTASWPDREYLIVEGDTELRPGLTLLQTPGHTPGHMSLLLRLPETGTVLLTVDALRTRAELDDRVSAGYWDEAVWQVSAERLARLAESESALVVFGHDADQWSTQRKAPSSFA